MRKYGAVVAVALIVAVGSSAAAAVTTRYLGDDAHWLGKAIQGDWVGNAGADGYHLLYWSGVEDQKSYPAYLEEARAINVRKSWCVAPGKTADARAATNPQGTLRSVGCWYADTGYIHLPVRQDSAFVLGIYMLDWDRTQRKAAVAVCDALQETAPLWEQQIDDYTNGYWVFTWVRANAGDTVSIRLRQTGGHEAAAAMLTFDQAATMISEFTASDRTTGSTLFTDEATVKVTLATEAGRNATVTGYAITESDEPPAPDDPAWRAKAPEAYTIKGPKGDVTLYAWAKDDKGEVAGSPMLLLYADGAPAVTNVQLNAETADSAIIVWSTNIETFGRVRYKTPDAKEWYATEWEAAHSNSHGRQAYGMEAGKTYMMVIENNGKSEQVELYRHNPPAAEVAQQAAPAQPVEVVRRQEAPTPALETRVVETVQVTPPPPQVVYVPAPAPPTQVVYLPAPQPAPVVVYQETVVREVVRPPFVRVVFSLGHPISWHVRIAPRLPVVICSPPHRPPVYVPWPHRVIGPPRPVIIYPPHRPVIVPSPWRGGGRHGSLEPQKSYDKGKVVVLDKPAAPGKPDLADRSHGSDQRWQPDSRNGSNDRRVEVDNAKPNYDRTRQQPSTGREPAWNRADKDGKVRVTELPSVRDKAGAPGQRNEKPVPVPEITRVTEVRPQPVPLDVNGDRRVDRNDLRSVADHLNQNPSSNPGIAANDVNKDGKVNILDVIKVRNQMGPAPEARKPSVAEKPRTIGTPPQPRADAKSEPRVDRIDVKSIGEHLGQDPAKRPEAAASDVNKDGKVNILDVIKARNQKIAEKKEKKQ